MLRLLAVVFGLLGPLIAPAAAQDSPRGSECLAMSQRAATRHACVGLRRLAAKAQEVTITYAGHSTYYIDAPEGVRIATDFSSSYTTGPLASTWSQ